MFLHFRKIYTMKIYDFQVEIFENFKDFRKIYIYLKLNINKLGLGIKKGGVKMRKILVLMCLLLFIAGCAEEDGSDIGPKQTPFVGGKTGLAMTFIEGAPPEAIFDNGQFPFSIVIKLDNKGEHDVAAGDGYIKIIGINPQEFGKTSADLQQSIPQDIRGTNKNSEGDVVSGDTVIMEFTDFNYLNDIQGNFDGPRIRPELCYDYETKTSSQICVKSDLLHDFETKEICSVSGTKTAYNSGGPIHITELKEAPLGSDKIQVSFKVDHVGDINDRFFKQGTECDYRVTNLDRYKVFIEVTSDINGQRASCTGLEEPTGDKSAGYVTLWDGQPRTVVCSIDVSGVEGVFEELFTVSLKYRYMQFIEKSILVKDVSTE